ncbi:MAG: thiamine phosphate synthase [Bacteroidetes bacterium]|nr:thiamine phosphate synthase [Bacteroidota bacterium]
MLAKLQYISQGSPAAEQIKNILEALDAGCKWVQLRFKNASEEEIKAVAEKVKVRCTEYNAAFIINDHPKIAKEVDADGVHLGLNDVSVAEARKIVGNGKIIGGTANTFEHIVQRSAEGCNYIGLGPFRFTTTKEKLSPILGAGGYAAITEKMRQQKIFTPVFAIGGIVLTDIETILQTGIYGIAVSGVVTNSADKKQIVQHLNSSLYAEANHR